MKFRFGSWTLASSLVLSVAVIGCEPPVEEKKEVPAPAPGPVTPKATEPTKPAETPAEPTKPAETPAPAPTPPAEPTKPAETPAPTPTPEPSKDAPKAPEAAPAPK